MKHIIEITGMSPRINAVTNQIMTGAIVTYRNKNGLPDRMELEGSHMEIMNMFGISSFSEPMGQKFEVELNDEKKIVGVVPVDDRQISYKDFQTLQKSVEKIITMLGQMKPPNQSQNNQK